MNMMRRATRVLALATLLVAIPTAIGGALAGVDGALVGLMAFPSLVVTAGLVGAASIALEVGMPREDDDR